MDNSNNITAAATSSASAAASAQQFCLRWHNHQTSLLSSLPILLDQSHLTDVTLSAEGKTLRAHRVVLSACSSFFSELFRTLDATYHPVIVIPGASFTALVALLTFMYSGEVNVFEEQIASLLSLAETLGIKGLADFNNSAMKSAKTNDHHRPTAKSPAPIAPSSTSAPSQSSCHQSHSHPHIPTQKDRETPPSDTSNHPKIPSPLESFLMKSFHFYPNLMSQPLNFSQSALNKTTEILAKYQQHYNLAHGIKDNNNTNNNGSYEDISTLCLDENFNNKRTNSGDKRITASGTGAAKDIKKIDKIAENLRCNSSQKPSTNAVSPKTMPLNMPRSSPPAQMVMKQPPFSGLTHHFQHHDDPAKMLDSPSSGMEHGNEAGNFNLVDSFAAESPLLDKPLLTNAAHMKQATNSKLYATCFICHKQLSNQYNLRVHLETHQNVRYACQVCSHVSRSKDALRKHVSYRHPGAPSPCESETRRKRAKPNAGGYNTALNMMKTPESPTPTDAQMAQQNFASQSLMSLYQNQFHQQQQQQQSAQSSTVHPQQQSPSPSAATAPETTTNLKSESTESGRSDSV